MLACSGSAHLESGNSVLGRRRLAVCFSESDRASTLVLRSSLAIFPYRRGDFWHWQIGTYSMRHTYRSWLDAAGTTVAVAQKLMRHGDIRTTMNVYGDVVTNEMQEAHAK